MSWASHNPERYDEIVHNGLVKYLDTLVDKAGFQVQGEWLEGYRALVETLHTSIPAHSLYNSLVFLAHKEIQTSEADYFSGLVDAAKERTDDPQ